MAANFDRWEKDPFFSAAEEVQESADRMESTYRTWIHEMKDESSVFDSDELRRDLQTALGTAKWQLEEFERAVKSSYVNNSSKEAKTRHSQFIDAISNQIGTVENSLKDSDGSEGKSNLPWVRLNEGERDELAVFLSGFTTTDANKPPLFPGKNKREVKETSPSLKKSCQSVEQDSDETKRDKVHGHRRAASASDLSAWKIAVADDSFLQSTSDGKPEHPIPRIVSFSGFLNTMEPMTKIKAPKNGFRKWKSSDRQQETDTLPLQSQQLNRGIDACYDRSKSCLDSCDDSYNKHLYGWLGAVQRRLQRSQYQIQYSRPVQVAMWIALAICMLVVYIQLAI